MGTAERKRLVLLHYPQHAAEIAVLGRRLRSWIDCFYIHETIDEDGHLLMFEIVLTF